VVCSQLEAPPRSLLVALLNCRQLTYLVGLAGLGVYAIAYALWPVLAPGLVDFVLMLVLTFMKYYYDNIYPRKQAEAKEVDLDGKPANEAEDAEEGTPVGADCRGAV